jgi:hypothetical protein
MAVSKNLTVAKGKGCCLGQGRREGPGRTVENTYSKEDGMSSNGKILKKQQVIRWHWFCFMEYQDKIFPELNPLHLKGDKK